MVTDPVTTYILHFPLAAHELLIGHRQDEDAFDLKVLDQPCQTLLDLLRICLMTGPPVEGSPTFVVSRSAERNHLKATSTLMLSQKHLRFGTHV